ncbi:MAG TPA: hypothetical protein PLP50_00335 [Thermoanaerobaculia bacterium]|jgi:hypothetical protein|nr:hypothetical protein [Thermoanaerobaculia bacterium]HQN06617.1 hypothetical protein [Thermoanaerobaculia bacterium]HQP84861.1 hypothetical protein [Thermoanaerobaculia bacterium]
MKRLTLLSLFAAAFAVFCSLPSRAEDTTIRFLDGSVAKPGDTWIADIKQKDGSVLAYRKNDDDIAKLVAALRSIPKVKKEMLTTAFWAARECAKTAGNQCSSGSCPSGKSCKQTGTTFTYCSCQ